jgi:hypothetical protein
MKSVLKWVFSGNRADRLLLAATVVAGVRMMLISAVFINFDLDQWTWFKAAEVWSGLAYAVLEGVALAYVSQLWVKLRPVHYVEWGYWAILALGQLVLLGSIIGVTGFAATAVRRGTGIDALLGDGGSVAWSMFTTALNPLMVIVIGIARAIDPAEQGDKKAEFITTRSRGNNSLGAFSIDELAEMLARKQPMLTPDNFVIVMRDSVGVELTIEDASRYLLAAQSAVNGNGRKKG